MMKLSAVFLLSLLLFTDSSKLVGGGICHRKKGLMGIDQLARQAPTFPISKLANNGSCYPTKVSGSALEGKHKL